MTFEMHSLMITQSSSCFVLYFWLGLGLEAKNYGLGLVDVALTSASCTYGLVNIPAKK